MWPGRAQCLQHTLLAKQLCEDGAVLCQDVQLLSWPARQLVLRWLQAASRMQASTDYSTSAFWFGHDQSLDAPPFAAYQHGQSIV